MLLSLVKKIGEINSDDILVSLIKEQSKYKKDHLFVIEVDPNKNTFQVNIEEYSENKEITYLRGIQGGNSSNLSPVLNIKPDELNKTGRIINFAKFPASVLESENKDELVIYPQLIEWLEQNKNSVEDEIKLKIKDNFFDKKKNKVNKSKCPTLLVFKVHDGESFKYPGEIDEFIKVYLSSAKVSKDKDSINGICYACGKFVNLIPVSKINKAVFEFFSLDLNNFVMGFDAKKTHQLNLCYDCQNDIQQGLNLMVNELSFPSYIKPINSRNNLFVNHILLPLVFDLQKLNEIISRIIQLKNIQSQTTTKRNEAENLKENLERVNKKIVRSAKNKIVKTTKKNKEDITTNSKIDERTLLKEFAKRGISYLDLFYTNERTGVSNTKIVFMDTTFVNVNKLQKFLEVLESIENKFNQKEFLLNKNVYRFEFKDLYSLFSIKEADLIRNSLLTGKKVSNREFSKNAISNLKDPFLVYNGGLKKQTLIKKYEYRRMLNTFLVLYELMCQLNLFRE